MKVPFHWAGGFTLAALLAACTTVQVSKNLQSHEPNSAPWIEPNQAIAILTFAPVESSLEAETVGCITESVKSAHPTLNVMNANEFRRMVFSYRIPDDEAERTKYLNAMMAQPVLRERMVSLGVRYLILLHGRTTTKPAPGGVVGGSPLGYALFATWDRKTNLLASFLDVRESRSIAELQSAASGTPWLFSTGIIFTIGAPALTEHAACKSLGEEVAKFLAGNAPKERSGIETSRDGS
jgi:hypothetical protein